MAAPVATCSVVGVTAFVVATLFAYGGSRAASVVTVLLLAAAVPLKRAFRHW